MPVEVYVDGADLNQIRTFARDPRIAGVTTNPTLARAAGVTHYRDFCERALAAADGKPVSLEVLADDLPEMERQAELLAGLGSNAVVKIPVMTTSGVSTAPIIAALATRGVPLNITAVFTVKQVFAVGQALGDAGGIVSVFAGRIADTGRNPRTVVTLCRDQLRIYCPHARMLWASPRQVYDVVLAERAGCEIITMTPSLIAKIALRGKDLDEYSRETVEMFARDAREAGFEL